MLEDIKEYVMNRLRNNRGNCDKWLCDFSHRIKKKLYDNGVKRTLCHMLWNGDNDFEVEYKGVILMWLT